MKKILLKTALVLTPIMALAEHPEGNYVADIQSQIRDDYRQLSEDRNAGFTDAVHADEKQIAEDKAQLREAQAHPGRPAPERHDLNNIRPAADDEVNAVPPSEKQEWKPNPDKLDPNNTFNHSASVDNEIR